MPAGKNVFKVYDRNIRLIARQRSTLKKFPCLYCQLGIYTTHKVCYPSQT